MACMRFAVLCGIDLGSTPCRHQLLSWDIIIRAMNTRHLVGSAASKCNTHTSLLKHVVYTMNCGIVQAFSDASGHVSTKLSISLPEWWSITRANNSINHINLKMPSRIGLNRQPPPNYLIFRFRISWYWCLIVSALIYHAGSRRWLEFVQLSVVSASERVAGCDEGEKWR